MFFIAREDGLAYDGLSPLKSDYDIHVYEHTVPAKDTSTFEVYVRLLGLITALGIRGLLVRVTARGRFMNAFGGACQSPLHVAWLRN